MTKTIGASLKAHIAQNLTTLATCWKLQRQDGVKFFFTDHDKDLVIDGDTYDAESGWLPSQLEQNRALAVDNMEATCFLDSDRIVEGEIHGRLFDHATLDVFLVNYEDLTQGKLYLCKGWIIGEVEIRDIDATAEVRGKTQKLQQEIVELYSPECRADLGDSRCGVNLALPQFNYTGTVDSVTVPRRKFIDAGSLGQGTSTSVSGAVSDVFRFGKLTWLDPSGSPSGSNLNAGLSMEVKKWSGNGEFELFESMPYTIQVGDTFFVTFGCDKSLTTCKKRFNNVVNFRGEPFIPGPDTLLQFRVPPVG